MDRMLTDEELITIAKRLKDVRGELGLTQQEFADKLFWDVSSYQKIESGKIPMVLDKAMQHRKDNNVDINYFVAEDSIHNEDTKMHMMINSSEQDSADIVFRLLEYLMQLIKMSPQNGDETDSDI